MAKRITVTRLILREMQKSKLNTLLCLLTVLIACALLIAMVALSRASVDATRFMMKQMGFNLLITPQGVDPADYQALNFQGEDMPEDYVTKLAEDPRMPAQHFVGKYQKTVSVNDSVAVLTGVIAEVVRSGTQKSPMPTAYDVKPGEAYLGAAIAQTLGSQPGDTLQIMGRDFKVGKLLEEAGTIPEDIRIYANLHDVQELVGKPGRINAIDALSCQCPVDANDIMAFLRNRINSVLPDVNVKGYSSILLARHKQRQMMYKLEIAALAIVMAAAAAAIWALTYQNVRSRRYEIGVLRALGVTDLRIIGLFAGKIVLYSLAGAVLGCAAGFYAADAVNFIERRVVFPRDIALILIVFTPIVAVIFGMPPIVSRLVQDPTDVLGDGGV